MSIIERALQKVQGQADGKSAPRHAGDPSAPVSVAPAANVSLHEPRRSIHFERSRLFDRNAVVGVEEAWLTTEEFRRIKWPLLNAAFGRDGRTDPCGPLLMVTSAVPGEGKTFVAVNLALSVASDLEGSALLVDGDLAKQHVSEMFGVANQPGLTDVLMDPDLDLTDVILGTNVPGLRLLPAGRHNPNAPELLASRRMSEVVEWLRTHYPQSLVVFDSPPLLATNEAQVLSQHVGQVLLVVKANDTPQAIVQEAVTLVAPGKPVSAILNQTTRSRAGQYYGAYYGRKERHGAAT